MTDLELRPSVPLSLMQNETIKVFCPSVPVSLAQKKLYLTDLELCSSVPLSLAKKVEFSHDFWPYSLCPSVFHAKWLRTVEKTVT